MRAGGSSTRCSSSGTASGRRATRDRPAAGRRPPVRHPRRLGRRRVHARRAPRRRLDRRQLHARGARRRDRAAAGRVGGRRARRRAADVVQPYYALGDGAEQAVERCLRDYYGAERVHGRDRRAGGDRRRDRARERRGVRRGGLRRADLLPLRPGPGAGRPARRRAAVTEFATYPSLRGQVAFVSGGATGLGAEFVAQLAAQGVRVGFVDIQDDAGQRARRDGVRAAPEPLYQHCDVRDIGALQDAIAATGERLGPVTVLVNNAANDERHARRDAERGEVGRVHGDQPAPPLLRHPGGRADDARGRARLGGEHGLDQPAHRPDGPAGLQHGEGRHRGPHRGRWRASWGRTASASTASSRAG